MEEADSTRALAAKSLGSMGPNRLRPVYLTVLVALCAALLGLPAASAQTVAYGVAAAQGAAGRLLPGAWVALAGARTQGLTVGFEVRYHDALQFALNVAGNQSFGPLGNVVGSLAASLRADGAGQAELGARAVIGPVALRLALLAFGDDPVRFAPLAATDTARPWFSAAGSGLKLGVSYRIGRTTILEAGQELYLVGGSLALRTDANLRLIRAIGENELRLLLRGFASPGLAAADVAAGVGLLLPRGRAPDWLVSAYLGYSALGLAPGVAVELAASPGGGRRIDLTAAYEPYRLDAPNLRLTGSLELGLGEGRLRIAAGVGALGPAVPAATWALESSYSVPLTGR